MAKHDTTIKILGGAAVGAAIGYYLGRHRTPANAATQAVTPPGSGVLPAGQWPSNSFASPIRSVLPSQLTVDQLLATCPTMDDLRQFHNEVGLRVNGLQVRMPPCTPGGSENSYALTAINALRLARLIRFTEPLPFLGGHSLYEALRSRNWRINFIAPSDNDYENYVPSGGTLQVSLPAGFDRSGYRSFWVGGVPTGGGLMGVLGRIVHIARHAMSGSVPHRRNNAPRGGSPSYNQFEVAWPVPLSQSRDGRFSDGGARAAEMVFYRALAEDSAGYLSAHQRHIARLMTDYLLNHGFVQQEPWLVTLPAHPTTLR